MKIKIIASVSANGVIGANNDLVLRDKEDLKRFKELTSGHNVVMGRKTWESLGSKPLPNRHNLVITKEVKEGNALVSYAKFDDVITLVEVFGGLALKEGDVKNTWIIGGGQLYMAFIGFADELHITKWNKEVEGDTHFPDIDLDVWERRFIEHPLHTKDYVYETWVRKPRDFNDLLQF